LRCVATFDYVSGIILNYVIKNTPKIVLCFC